MASKAKSSRRLRSAVVANAKAIDAVKKREFGYWQTTNSVLNGATPIEHMGSSYNDLTTSTPALIHLNNLHSCNGALPVDPNTSSEHTPVPHDEQQGACHLLVASTDAAWPDTQKDGLIRSFRQPATFAVNGVLQKQKRSGPHMYPRVGYPGQDPITNPNDTPLIPIPNGKKVKWGGVDLQFRIEGALQDTQFDFYIVTCKKSAPLVWDPWHQTIPSDARSVPGVLPYTINDFQHLHHRMYPKKLDTKRYNVLSHRRVLVNNVHRVTGQSAHNHLMPDNAKYATGNTWSHTIQDNGPWNMTPTHPATTPTAQHLHMSYKPNKVVRPLRNFIGERLDTPTEQRGSYADANPLEKATLGTMSWDNFHPSSNVWLVMTTNHTAITTPRIHGPYTHKGYSNWTTLTGADKWHWQDKEIEQEPENYTLWRASDHGGAYAGYDDRESQLEHQIRVLTNTANASSQSWYEHYVEGGRYYEEWRKLVDERLDRDAYRNPRIHIFRRTWWQDEHIPTELSESYAMTEKEAAIRPTPVTPAANVKAPTVAAAAEIQRRFQRTKIALARAAEEGVPGFDTSDPNPNLWSQWAQGAAGYLSGATMPAEIQSLIDTLAVDAGLCDFFGIDRWTYNLLKRMASQVQPPTPTAPLRVKRQRGEGTSMEPSNDPMQQEAPPPSPA